MVPTRPETDRLPPDADVAELAFLLLAVVLAGLHLYLGLFAPFVPAARSAEFVVVALVLLAGPVLYVTPYWRPVNYLLGAGLAVYLALLWVLGGMEYRQVGVLVGAAATAFVCLGLYLFFREELGRLRSTPGGR